MSGAYAYRKKKSETDEPTYEVERILEKRTLAGVTQYRILWVGFPMNEATWEAEDECDCPDMIKEFEEAQKYRERGKDVISPYMSPKRRRYEVQEDSAEPSESNSTVSSVSNKRSARQSDAPSKRKSTRSEDSTKSPLKKRFAREHVEVSVRKSGSRSRGDESFAINKGHKVIKVAGVNFQGAEPRYLVSYSKYKGNSAADELVPSHLLREHAPEKLIDFCESYMKVDAEEEP